MALVIRDRIPLACAINFFFGKVWFGKFLTLDCLFRGNIEKLSRVT